MERISLEFNLGPRPCNLIQYLPPPHPPPRVSRSFHKLQVSTGVTTTMLLGLYSRKKDNENIVSAFKLIAKQQLLCLIDSFYTLNR